MAHFAEKGLGGVVRSYSECVPSQAVRSIFSHLPAIFIFHALPSLSNDSLYRREVVGVRRYIVLG